MAPLFDGNLAFFCLLVNEINTELQELLPEFAPLDGIEEVQDLNHLLGIFPGVEDVPNDIDALTINGDADGGYVVSLLARVADYTLYELHSLGIVALLFLNVLVNAMTNEAVDELLIGGIGKLKESRLERV